MLHKIETLQEYARKRQTIICRKRLAVAHRRIVNIKPGKWASAPGNRAQAYDWGKAGDSDLSRTFLESSLAARKRVGLIVGIRQPWRTTSCRVGHVGIWLENSLGGHVWPSCKLHSPIPAVPPCNIGALHIRRMRTTKQGRRIYMEKCKIANPMLCYAMPCYAMLCSRYELEHQSSWNVVASRTNETSYRT